MKRELTTIMSEADLTFLFMWPVDSGCVVEVGYRDTVLLFTVYRAGSGTLRVGFAPGSHGVDIDVSVFSFALKQATTRILAEEEAAVSNPYRSS